MLRQVSCALAFFIAASVLGATQSKADNLEDCNTFGNVMDQKRCLSRNIGRYKEQIGKKISDTCMKQARDEGNEGSALVLISLICIEGEYAGVLSGLK